MPSEAAGGGLRRDDLEVKNFLGLFWLDSDSPSSETQENMYHGHHPTSGSQENFGSKLGVIWGQKGSKSELVENRSDRISEVGSRKISSRNVEKHQVGGADT